jgi:N-methylhydantoinase A
VNCPLRGGVKDTVALEHSHSSSGMRSVYFGGLGAVNAAILRLEAMTPGAQFAGPAIVESSFTTIVLNPGARAERTASGSLAIEPGTLAAPGAQAPAIKAVG